MSKGKKRRSKSDTMYAKYGEHSPGVYCGGCCNCQRRKRNDGLWKFKCIAYGVTKTFETDWNPMFTACGNFNNPFDPDHDTSLIETKSFKRLVKASNRFTVASRKAGTIAKEVAQAFEKLGKPGKERR